jgi:hypothetical protein
MKFLKNVEGSTRNTAIRNEINIFNSNGRIDNNRLNCIPHGERIEPDRNPKHLTCYTLREQDPLDTRPHHLLQHSKELENGVSSSYVM